MHCREGYPKMHFAVPVAPHGKTAYFSEPFRPPCTTFYEFLLKKGFFLVLRPTLYCTAFHLPFVNRFCQSLEGVRVEVRFRLGSKVGQESAQSRAKGGVQVSTIGFVLFPSVIFVKLKFNEAANPSSWKLFHLSLIHCDSAIPLRRSLRSVWSLIFCSSSLFAVSNSEVEYDFGRDIILMSLFFVV